MTNTERMEMLTAYKDAKKALEANEELAMTNQLNHKQIIDVMNKRQQLLTKVNTLYCKLLNDKQGGTING